MEMELSNSENSILLHNAVEHETEEHVKNILLKNVNVNEVDRYNRTALHIATTKKRKAIVEMLIENGANINIKEKSLGMTPLHLALKQKDLSIIKLLLAKGANINEVTKHNSVALHIALESKDKRLVKLILDHGADINAKKFGKSPLHLAVEYAAVDLAKLLLERGSNINDVCTSGQTALHIAIEMKDIKMVKLLLSNNARTDIKKFGKCALSLAVQSGCIEIAKLILINIKENYNNFENYLKNLQAALLLSVQNKDKMMTHVFLESGIDPNIKISDKSLLHYATEYEWVDTVHILLMSGAYASAVTSNNVSPLHVALKTKNNDIVRLLVAHGADLNVQQSRSGVSPVHLAVESGYPELVKLLLESGACPNVTSNLSLTPLQMAFESQNHEMVVSLLEHGADTMAPKYGKSLLELAIEYKWTDLARQLLLRGANANAIGSDNFPMLMIAIKHKCPEIVQLLADFGADVNYVYEGKTEITPLQYAVICKCDEAAEILLRMDAVNINFLSNTGNTALQLAFEKRNGRMVKLLLERGARLGLRKRLMKPLHLAAENKWVEVAQILIDKGENVNELTFYGLTAIRLAVERNDIAMTKLLLQHGAKVNSEWHGQSLLHIAVNSKFEAMVELLLDRGAEINYYNRHDYENMCALHIALRNSDENMARLLIERNARINMREPKFGKSPLHLAVEFDLMETAKLLVKRGAKINQGDNTQVTPLLLAVTKNRIPMTKFLLNHGADPNVTNRVDNCTCLRHAVISLDFELTELLLSAGASVHANCTFEGFLTAFEICARHVRSARMMRLLMTWDFDKGKRNTERIDKILRIVLRWDSPFNAIIVSHLARLDSNISHTKFGLRDRPSDSVPKIHYDVCVRELKYMDTVKFYNNYSFYKILQTKTPDLALLTRNSNFMAAFRENFTRSKFPTYASIMREHMRKAETFNKLLSASENMLTILLKFEFPHILVQKILNYLNISDLRVMNTLHTEYLKCTE